MFGCFSRSVVINLPSRNDRRSEILIELGRVRATGVEFFPAISFQDAGHFYSVGARGCYASQTAVLRSAVGQKNVLVMEDDLNFAVDFELRKHVVEQLPHDWGIFYGGYLNELHLKKAGIGELSPEEEVVGAHFYAVNGPVVKRLVDALDTFLRREPGHPEGGPMSFDGALTTFRFQNPGVRTFAAFPPLGYQRSSRTDVGNQRWFDNVPFVREVFAKLRKARNSLR